MTKRSAEENKSKLLVRIEKVSLLFSFFFFCKASNKVSLELLLHRFIPKLFRFFSFPSQDHIQIVQHFLLIYKVFEDVFRRSLDLTYSSKARSELVLDNSSKALLQHEAFHLVIMQVVSYSSQKTTLVRSASYPSYQLTPAE